MPKPRLFKSMLSGLAWLISALAVVLFAGSAILMSFDWNRAKPWLNARTSDALGRAFTINGNLRLNWEKNPVLENGKKHGWRDRISWPHLVAQDIHIANPKETGSVTSYPDEFASFKEVKFSIQPLALLEKKIVIPTLYLKSPVIHLQRSADNQNNWTFKNPENTSTWRLQLQSINLAKGSVHLSDAIKHAEITAHIDTLTADPEFGVEWQLHGKLGHESVSGSGKAGAVLLLQQHMQPYPIMALLHVGPSTISIHGALTKPTDLAALDMRLAVSGPSMARLFTLTGIVLPETPPFSTEGHLKATLKPQGSHWSYDNFRGKVGSSDIHGTLDFLSKSPRPLLSGSVESHSLLFADLAPLIGADSNASKRKRGAPIVQPAGKIFPVETFRTERWNSMDVDVQFSANKFIHKKDLPINKLMTHLRLQDGVLLLDPLNFGLAGGTLNSAIRLDGSGKIGKAAINATIKMRARHLKLTQLLPALQSVNARLGEINGDVSLTATGNSVASLLGASNGDITALMKQGSVSKLLLEQIGLNIGSIIFTKIVGDKQVKLHCLVADFTVRKGVMQTRRFFVDTDEAFLGVSGNINLAQEQLDLTIKSKSKGLRVISLRAPLYVRGSFQDPGVKVDKGVMAMRAGGAIALGLFAPYAALLPVVNTGQTEHDECTQRLAQAGIKTASPTNSKRP